MQLNTVKITQMCYCGTVGVCLDVSVCVCVSKSTESRSMHLCLCVLMNMCLDS